jgi:hypothetical protein
VPAPVRTAEDALTTVALATNAGRTSCVVIGGLDRGRRPLTLVVVDDARPPDLALAVDVVLAALGPAGTSPITAVFLASSGGAAPVGIGPAECALFADLDRRLGGAGIALLDWFVLRDGSATSVAHRAGRPPGW